MRRRAPFVWLVVALLALTGCSEPQQANDTLPTAPATTSAEPTLEPLGPADFPVPDDARVQTEAGAIAMATYYLDLIDYYFASLPDGYPTADWLSQLSSHCETCDSYVSLYSTWRDLAYSYTGGDAVIESLGPITVESSSADIAWFVQATAAELLDVSGAPIADGSTPATRLSGGIAFVWESLRSAWIVEQVNLVPVP